VQRIALDGKLLWDFPWADERRCQHHDIEPLPNGHVLLIAWEKKTRAEVLAAGRDPELQIGEELWPDCILEIEPQGETGGQIVWNGMCGIIWSRTTTKTNPAMASGRPSGADRPHFRQRAPRVTPADVERLRALGTWAGARMSRRPTQVARPVR